MQKIPKESSQIKLGISPAVIRVTVKPQTCHNLNETFYAYFRIILHNRCATSFQTLKVVVFYFY